MQALVVRDLQRDIYGRLLCRLRAHRTIGAIQVFPGCRDRLFNRLIQWLGSEFRELDQQRKIGTIDYTTRRRFACPYRQVRWCPAKNVCHDDNPVTRVNVGDGLRDRLCPFVTITISPDRDCGGSGLFPHYVLHRGQIFFCQPTMGNDNYTDHLTPTPGKRALVALLCRSSSRCRIDTCHPRSARFFAMVSTAKTDLCWPPVHPSAMVR